MSTRTLSISIPAALLALGMIAVSSSASFATDNAHDDYASSPSHVAGFTLQANEVAHKKRKHTSRHTDRFSGFGFRGDGFRTSGKYN